MADTDPLWVFRISWKKFWWDMLCKGRRTLLSLLDKPLYRINSWLGAGAWILKCLSQEATHGFDRMKAKIILEYPYNDNLLTSRYGCNASVHCQWTPKLHVCWKMPNHVTLWVVTVPHPFEAITKQRSRGISFYVFTGAWFFRWSGSGGITVSKCCL